MLALGYLGTICFFHGPMWPFCSVLIVRMVDREVKMGRGDFFREQIEAARIAPPKQSQAASDDNVCASNRVDKWLGFT